MGKSLVSCFLTHGVAGGVPHFYRQGGRRRVPHSPTFWTEIRAKISPLLQLVTY